MAKRQPSSIDRLPPDILEQFHELLRDPRVTQLEATARINAILAEDGHTDRLSKSAVNRYAVRMEAVGARLRQSREVAKMWIGRLGAEPQGEVGKLLNEMIRTLAFETAMKLGEGDDIAEPKILKDLSIAVERLEKAASENMKREEEIRKKAKTQAVDAMEKAAAKQGTSSATIDMLREAIMSELAA